MICPHWICAGNSWLRSWVLCVWKWFPGRFVAFQDAGGAWLTFEVLLLPLEEKPGTCCLQVREDLFKFLQLFEDGRDYSFYCLPFSDVCHQVQLTCVCRLCLREPLLSLSLPWTVASLFILWTNWSPLKSSVVIMLPIFLTPLKILFILGCCNQALPSDFTPSTTSSFPKSGRCITASAWPVPNVLWNSTGLPVTLCGSSQQLLGWMQFTMRTWRSSCFLKKASSSGSDGLWQVLVTVSFGLASHPDLFTFYWPVNHFSAELHTFRLFLCIEWIPVTFPVCPCAACHHPSPSSRHVSCSTVCL